MIFLLFWLLSVCPLAQGMKSFALNPDASSSAPAVALMNAAFFGDAEYVEKACGAGVLVNQPEEHLPLHAAIEGVRYWDRAWQEALERQMKVAKILLSYGAGFELKTRNSRGTTVFHECLNSDFACLKERPRKFILGLIIFEELLKTIFATQGPIPQAFTPLWPLAITEEEAVSFKRKVWNALLKVDNYGRRSIDLICTKECIHTHDQLCPASAINELYIAQLFEVVLKEAHDIAKAQEESAVNDQRVTKP